jgi:hypothetical protein
MLLGKPEGKRVLGRQRCKWMDNIEMDFGEMGRCGLDWLRIGTREGLL